MIRFADVLRETSDRLDIPQPAKSRILLEIAGDMEDLYALESERGASPEPARPVVVEHFRLSDDALTDLLRVQTSGVRRFLDGLAEQARGHLERALLVTFLLLGVLVTLPPALGAKLVGRGGPLGWLALAFTLVGWSWQ